MLNKNIKKEYAVMKGLSPQGTVPELNRRPLNVP
jgi:hypothetical protein